MYFTCEDALSALSLWVLERVHEVRETADGDGTKTGVEVRLACEPNGSDGCRRENSLHALLQYNLVRASSADSGSFGPVLLHVAFRIAKKWTKKKGLFRDQYYSRI